jgi:hypothetical protein
MFMNITHMICNNTRKQPYRQYFLGLIHHRHVQSGMLYGESFYTITDYGLGLWCLTPLSTIFQSVCFLFFFKFDIDRKFNVNKKN